MKTTRPDTLLKAVALVLLLAVAGCTTTASTPKRPDLAELKEAQAMVTPAQVLESLRKGNECFAAGKRENRDMLHDQQTTAAGQYPRAVILSCIYDLDTGRVQFLD